MAQKTLDLEFSGLWTSANPFSKAPGGALETADNVVLRNPSLIEPRRGYEASAANPSGNVSRVAPWGGRVFSFAENGDLRDYSIGTGWSSAYGTYTQPDASSPFRTASAAKTLFFTTASGVKALDKVGGTVLDAGIGPSPFLYGSPDSNGGTWLYAGGSAAYCIVLCRYDANNQLIQSAPSPSAIVSDTPDWPVPTGSAAKATGSSTVTVTAGGVHPFTVGQLITVWFDGAETSFASGTFIVASVPDASHFTYDDHQTQSTGSTVHNVTGANFGTLHGVTVTAYLPKPGYTGATFAQLYRSFSTPRGVTPTSEFFLVSEHKLSAAEIALGSFSFASDVTTDTFLSSPLYTNANSGDGLAASNDLPPLARDLCPVENRLLYVNTTDKHTVELQLIGTDTLHVGSTIVIAGDTYTAGETELFADKQFHLFTSGTAAQNIENTARSLAGVVMNYNLISPTPKVLALYTSGPVDPPGKILIQEVGIGGSAFTVNAGTAGQTCWVPDLSVTTNIVTSDNNRQPARVSYSNDGEPWGVPADNWSQVGAADKAALRAILVRSTVFIFKEDGLFTWQFGSDGAPVVTPFDPGLVLLAPDSCAVVGNQIFCLTNRGAVYVSESGVSPAVSKPIERDISYIQANYDQYPTATFGIGYEEEGLYLLALPASSSDTGCSQQYVFNTNSPAWTRWLISSAVHGCYDPEEQMLVLAVGASLWLERKAFTSNDIQDPGGAAYSCVVKLLPTGAGDPLFEKKFLTALLAFKVAEFTTCYIGFDSDRSAVASSGAKSGPLAAGWGGFPWGTLPWSQPSRNFIVRADMPQGTLLACMLGVTFTVEQASAFWQLQGISILYEPTTNLPRRGT